MCAAFGKPDQLMSDGPRYFKNETIGMLNRVHKVPNHFTLPDKLWQNGSTASLGKELSRIFRAPVPELGTLIEEWTDLLPFV